MAIIELDKVSKNFGTLRVLSDVSFRCDDGDILVLFGPPGSGKSTLLRAIAGLEPVDGEIKFNGKSQENVPTHMRNVAMAFESYALYPHFTVRKNIEFPLKAPGVRMATSERASRIKAVSELLNIPHLLDRLPHQLSGGQRQRVSLGRALVRSANATLLDEPLAHLDAQLRSSLRGDLRLFLKEQRSTTVYATPDFQEGFGIANNVMVLINGKVHQVGTPEKVFARPADAMVAKLVGDPAMNLLTLDAAGMMHVGATRVPTPLRFEAASRPSQVGFRPSSVLLSEPNDSAWNAPIGRVVLIERIGSSSVLEVDVGGITVAAKSDKPTSSLKVGDSVALSFAWQEVHLFGSDARRLSGQDHSKLLSGGASQ